MEGPEDTAWWNFEELFKMTKKLHKIKKSFVRKLIAESFINAKYNFKEAGEPGLRMLFGQS